MHIQFLFRFVAATFRAQQNRAILAEIAFLRAENAFYRQQLPAKRFSFSVAWRRRFAETGVKVGWARLKHICTVAAVGTIQRWNSRLRKGLLSVPVIGRGRPRVKQEVEALVLRMTRENPSWGQSRIVGELEGLGHIICPRTVAAIWKRNGIEPPDPQKRMRESIWKPFIAGHAHEIVATDFFTADVWGWLGRKTIYVLFCIHIATRRVHIMGVSQHPDEAFMKQVGRNDTMAEVGFLKQVGARYMIHDGDTKFCESWRHILSEAGVEPLKLPPNSPDLNCYAERWVRSVKRECIRRLTFLGIAGLRRALREYLEHYHAERPHQSLGNRPPLAQTATQKIDPDALRRPIKCRERCGGVLKHYYRDAA